MKTPCEDQVCKGGNFADFVRYRHILMQGTQYLCRPIGGNTVINAFHIYIHIYIYIYIYIIYIYIIYIIYIYI